jgi:hypothetical protein
MEYIFPGFTPSQLEGKVWWFPFQQLPDLPEALVDGKEIMYLSWFYHNLAYNPAAIMQVDINEFVNHYSTLGGMGDGFNYFKHSQKMQFKMRIIQRVSLRCQTSFVAGYIPAFGGDVILTMRSMECKN